jgi:uncharacterized OB-fold protein
MGGAALPPGPGVVYTETVVHSAPEAFVGEAPYQIAIVALESGARVTGRILGDRISIGDSVDFVEFRDGIPYFRRSHR